MDYSEVKIGDIEGYWNVSHTRILKYTVEIYHMGLCEHKIISAPSIEMVENKIFIQIKKWADRWEILNTKKKINLDKEASVKEASLLTQQAEDAIKEIDSLLIDTLSVDDTVDWDQLKKKEEYPEPLPEKPVRPNPRKMPEMPKKDSKHYTPTFSLFEKLIKSRKKKKIKIYEDKYTAALVEWEKQKKEIGNINHKLNQLYENKVTEWENAVAEWESAKQMFIQNQGNFNLKIDEMRESYLNGDAGAVSEYCEIVLNNSVYPDTFIKNFELDYNPDNKILIVEYELPSIECFPTIKEVKYIASRKELKESYLTEAQINNMFDDATYKITLRTLHELFEADVVNAIDAISFNGWVTSINKASGKRETNCILSIQVKKVDFIEIDLANVDPKICFKNLKGVASSKLSSLTPIKPILQLNKEDKRFVESYSVVGQIEDTTNLAAMDWEDFEHLIRELFEKEFETGGGEVKVTQASRDGGVDAVAFDPDPIRGGKIIIQAKRYTNTVGVSAVRDLYGTIVNEGATKGILVTTADYGPDAYEFAKGKPITLLSGSNLLHLLGKHGHHAKIDIKEAKRILSEKEQI